MRPPADEAGRRDRRQAAKEQKVRGGLGYDIHKLVFGRPLVLGGIHLERGKGAMGHSDGDCLAHAIIDALLGASGLGDIGHHFPDTDPKYKDADSMELLQRAYAMVTGMGLRLVNLDCTVHLEHPKIGRLKTEMAARIAQALDVASHQVNVKAKTAEGLGEIGKNEAVAAEALVLLEEAG